MLEGGWAERQQIDGGASALWLMALFTAAWTIAAAAAINNPAGLVIPAIGITVAGWFMLQARAVQQALQALAPIEPTAAEQAADKRRGSQLLGAFFAEGLVIFLVLQILSNSGHKAFSVLAVALIVGLHFVPLPRLLQRPLLVVAGVALAVVAAVGMAVLRGHASRKDPIDAIVASAGALTTAAVGLDRLRDITPRLAQLQASAGLRPAS